MENGNTDNILKSISDSVESAENTQIEAESAVLSNSDLEQAEITALELRAKKAEKTAKIARNIFYGIFAVALIMIGYFFFKFESVSSFPEQAGLKLIDTEAQTQIERTKHDLLLYQLLRIDLEELSFQGAQFIVDVENSQVDIVLRKDLEQILTRINYRINQLSNLKSEDPLNARVELAQNLPRELTQTSIKRMLGSRLIHERLANTGELKEILAKPDQEFANYLKEITTELPTPEGTLNKVALNKLIWTNIIVKIENITKAIDPNFSTNNRFIEYSNYNFNAATQTISITGQVRTQDDQTFSLIADLIDAIESDPLFANVSMRSFAKNPNTSDGNLEGFQSSINLSFSYVPATSESNPEADA